MPNKKPITRYDLNPSEKFEPRLAVEEFQWRIGEPAETAKDSMDGTASGAPLTLTATMMIGKASFHVEAYLVEYVAQWSKYGTRRFKRPGLGRKNQTIELRRNDEQTSWLWQAHGMDGYCETVRIQGPGNGRQYAIFISPFCT